MCLVRALTSARVAQMGTWSLPRAYWRALRVVHVCVQLYTYACRFTFVGSPGPLRSLWYLL